MRGSLIWPFPLFNYTDCQLTSPALRRPAISELPNGIGCNFFGLVVFHPGVLNLLKHAPFSRYHSDDARQNTGMFLSSILEFKKPSKRSSCTMRLSYVIRSLVFALFLLSLSGASYAQVGAGISVSFGPPPLPVYAQPVCPGDGYLWVPGYWAWDPNFDDYYWVPGTWVLAPEVGFFWTPGWWGWGGTAFIWHEGYWGPHVGFYGGINYGFGYFGHGFVGGRWDGGHFFYNREVTNVNVTVIRNVYNEKTVNNYSSSHVSFNGGEGGINDRPTAEEESYDRERHIGPVAAQTQHIDAARNNPQLRASYNHGKPSIAATPRPGEFSGRDVVAAKESGGHWEPPANRGGNNSRSEEVNTARNAVHPTDLPPLERATPPNTGNAKLDAKYQQQQEKLYQKQMQDRQKLQQQQDKEHQEMEQRNASEAEKQQIEQHHQQQTQQMYQQHAQQRQNLEQKQQTHASHH
jgi:hypothetical protein